MGNCSNKADKNVVGHSSSGLQRDASSSAESPPAAPARGRRHSNPATPEKNKNKKQRAAADEASPSAQITHDHSHAPPILNNNNNNNNTDPNAAKHADNAKPKNKESTNDNAKEPGNDAAAAAAAAAPPHTASESHSAPPDSIAMRMEQGSTYVWLRHTYSNPHLKPTPLLTLEGLRQLRNRNVAFQRLWGVLGEAACVIGPYAAAPTPSPIPALADTANASVSVRASVGGPGEDEFHVEPSFVNDEERLPHGGACGGRHISAGGGVSGGAAGAASAPRKPASGAAGKDGSADPSVVHEVRLLNQQHISIEGDPSQKHPIVCRGAVYRGKHVWIHKIHQRCCFLFESMSAVDIHDCTDALIVLAPTAGAVSLSNCHRCFIVATAAQLRVLSCDALIFSVNVAGFPVIEKSTSIGFAPLVGWYAYSKLPSDFCVAGLSLFTNNYSTVRDVTPPTTQPPPLSSPSAGLANTSTLSLSGASSGAAAALGATASVKPVNSNFVYLDMWELEAAVWKAMAEQRWSQLIAETDAVAAAATAAAAAAGSPTTATQFKSDEDDERGNGGNGGERGSTTPFLTALSPGMSPLTAATGDFNEEDKEDNNLDKTTRQKDGQAERAASAAAAAAEEEEEEELVDDDDPRNSLPPKEGSLEDMHDTDKAFHSMISFGNFTPSAVSKTQVKGSSATTSADVSRSKASTSTAAAAGAHRHVSPAAMASVEAANDSVAPLPRWRQAGFACNIATDGQPANSAAATGHHQQQKNSVSQEVSMRLRTTAREAEHLVRVVLRSVPLLPLSALRDAPFLFLDSDAELIEKEDADDKSTAAAALAVEGNKGKTSAGEKKKGGDASAAVAVAAGTGGSGDASLTKKMSRYNPLELALAIYTHTCAAPSTFGAQLIPADFFEQRWKLKLIVLSVKGGGYNVARRIARDVEASRRRCFLETVHAMLHAPPPSFPIDSATKNRKDKSGTGKGSSAEDKGEEEEDEDTFSEVMWHYLRTTSLTQRCGSVLLLNTVELRCTETAVREFVAPVFYKLCEPVGLKGGGNATGRGPATNASNAGSNSGGGSRGLHLPWKSNSSNATNNSTSGGGAAESSAQQADHNVEMRRLFGTAIQRMTGQTCVAMLALMAPKNVPQSFQRPPGAGGPSIGSALTPAELQAWAKRADDAQHIFSPQKDVSDDPHESLTHGETTQGDASQSHDEPIVAEDDGQADGDKKKHGPTFAPTQEGEADPLSFEERVWPQTVLLNVTVPLRFVSLLQGTLFFKSQMHVAASAGGQVAREPASAKP